MPDKLLSPSTSTTSLSPQMKAVLDLLIAYLLEIDSESVVLTIVEHSFGGQDERFTSGVQPPGQ